MKPQQPSSEQPVTWTTYKIAAKHAQRRVLARGRPLPPWQVRIGQVDEEEAKIREHVRERQREYTRKRGLI